MAFSDREEEKSLLVGRRVKVIEYLEPTMSSELLSKFPDNSSYDFDYFQSSIWSPLISPPFTPVKSLNSFIPFRNLSFDLNNDDYIELRHFSGQKKLGSKLRSKFSSSGFNLKLDLLKSNTKKMIMKRKKSKILPSDLSPTPSMMKTSCNPIIKKGWDKVLKVASKQFKKRKMKRDPTAHVMLPKYF